MTSSTDVVAEFRRVLRASGLHEALGVLNGTTDFRFSGVYLFVGELVVNVVLFDRENPHLPIGEDVRLEESYCMLTAHDGESCGIEDSTADERLVGHAARRAVRSYCAVLLDGSDGDGSDGEGSDGEGLGTLCHFDVVPRPASDEVFALLGAVRTDVSEAVFSGRGLPERTPGEYRIADFSAGREDRPSTSSA